MANLSISEQTLARLRAAAAARNVSLEMYLEELAKLQPNESGDAESDFGRSSKSEDRRKSAADSIRKLASEIKSKSSIEELIADKHSGHKY
jgi:hypothetical protein